MDTKEIDEMEAEEIKSAAKAEEPHRYRLVSKGPEPESKKDKTAATGTTKFFRAVKSRKEHEKGYYRLVYEGPKPKTKCQAWALALAKWEFVVRWYDAHSERLLEGATKTCGLCMLYESNHSPFCEKCPVRISTGITGCGQTPWGTYNYALDESASALQAAARAELEFLRAVKEEEVA